MTYSDYVEVIPGLFLGSHPEEDDAFIHGAAAVVCLSDRLSTSGAPRDHLYVQWAIKDGPVPDEASLHAVCALIRAWLEAGRSVFVHCDAGMNRSALVVAAVLVTSGMAPDDAVSLVRSKRQGSLGEGYAAFIP
ncbi:MAG: protein-tyrosine phosphatase family protein, partial [Actinomycetota bacterium]